MNLKLLFIGGTILFQVVIAGFGQGSAFLYQGQLTASGSPANGSYDLTFSLFNGSGSVGNTLTNPATAVSNGLFSVALDFGPGVFNGSNLWLQIGVRTNSGGAFTSLAPMQPILPAPYAITAGTASNLAGPFSGDGSGLTNVNAALLNGLAASDYATLDVLTNYATVASVSNASGGSAIPNIQVYDSPGTTQFTVPSNVTQIMVEVWGGGGGGGNANASAAGGGGGAGGYGKGVFAVTPGSNYAVVVGAGGTNTVAGGASSLGALISAGGGSAGANAPAKQGGSGGASTAVINISGGTGQWSATLGGSCGGNAGNGGSGGLGDMLVSGSYAGGSGQAPGGGGGGGYDGNDPGGPGGHGRVIIYY